MGLLGAFLCCARGDFESVGLKARPHDTSFLSAQVRDDCACTVAGDLILLAALFSRMRSHLGGVMVCASAWLAQQVLCGGSNWKGAAEFQAATARPRCRMSSEQK